MSNLLNTRAELLRRANREEQRLESQQLPRLWILTPTASEALLSSFNFMLPEESEGWGRGVYFLSEVWRVGLIAIHQLPNVPETMWLRILGKGKVQQGAIAELTRLPVDSPLRASTLELLYNLQANLQVNLAASAPGNQEDKELVMALVPLLQQKIDEATQQGREEGRQEGREEAQRLILQNFLQVRFGELDAQTIAFFSSVSALPVGEFTMLLVQLSTLPIAQADRQQVRTLIAENVLRKRFGQLEVNTVNLIPNLLALSAENLSLLLSQLPDLSIEELMARLENSSL
ncbi:flagellar assembly protein H [Microcoleus sp. N9_A1]|uniref:flagellar assembly protein H n=1 Tax=Microcoleus sp. N9_A1 TaxID=3055380 RepID=UPI002FD59E41